MERVIREFRVIETDDGYRIEIKGDKERMKGFMRGFGRRRWRRGPLRRMFAMHGMPFGFGFGPMMWGCGPMDSDVEFDQEDEEQGETSEA